MEMIRDYIKLKEIERKERRHYNLNCSYYSLTISSKTEKQYNPMGTHGRC